MQAATSCFHEFGGGILGESAQAAALPLKSWSVSETLVRLARDQLRIFAWKPNQAFHLKSTEGLQPRPVPEVSVLPQVADVGQDRLPPGR